MRCGIGFLRRGLQPEMGRCGGAVRPGAACRLCLAAGGGGRAAVWAAVPYDLHLRQRLRLEPASAVRRRDGGGYSHGCPGGSAGRRRDLVGVPEAGGVSPGAGVADPPFRLHGGDGYRPGCAVFILPAVRPRPSDSHRPRPQAKRPPGQPSDRHGGDSHGSGVGSAVSGIPTRELCKPLGSDPGRHSLLVPEHPGKGGKRPAGGDRFRLLSGAGSCAPCVPGAENRVARNGDGGHGGDRRHPLPPGAGL